MKKLLLGAVAAVGLALGFAPQQASAHWERRAVYRWDPGCCRYVVTYHRYWVAPPRVVVAPAPAVVPVVPVVPAVRAQVYYPPRPVYVAPTPAVIIGP